MGRSSPRRRVLRQASTWLVLPLVLACDAQQFAPPDIAALIHFEGPRMGLVGEPLEVELSVDEGVPPFVWTRSAGVPGLHLEDDGSANATYTGVPELAGVYSVAFTAQDVEGLTASGSLTLDILPLPPRFVTEELPVAMEGVYYSAELEVADGRPPLSIDVSNLPEGLTFDGGTIVGRARYAGTSTIVARVRDAAMRSASMAYPLVVEPR